ncbi:MAG: 30S ribosomal protein S17 [Deltaproteobacteria bacterium RIFCSPLOWO2_02_FULL_50_16]|nr:MAG: 30S ribosomal protein S17 [Deltaproteobacteria bacterium GWA2_50_8]OGQ26925.1 MAG: 30S ribosomal protein S17 [Deltaproteobacteria bacterium RIFCSPHIGHO2_02_FULL_50_15]OGQ56187.1 MAG: 30S ribosomal protein S17 [Deltaproteobacteria bacterium RIFCSPLOWO2_02_FULL_50_16]OGQ67044.1 MAG: 30S ribosomal protein S17 [Deltaproteobacteria bacterium RIFCSPLOWO2_12_FULL_50_11]
MAERTKRKTMFGTVLSNKMDKTVVVGIDRRIFHKEYKKYLSIQNKLKAHDEKNECQLGDKVMIQEDRPISRDKSWRVSKIIEKATTHDKDEE